MDQAFKNYLKKNNWAFWIVLIILSLTGSYPIPIICACVVIILFVDLPNGVERERLLIQLADLRKKVENLNP